MDEDEEMQSRSLLKSGRRDLDTKTILLGGGLLALILFLLFRNRGSAGGSVQSPLVFKLSPHGLTLDGNAIAIDDAIARVLARKQTSALLSPTGDARQGDVDFVILQFQKAGISLSVRQLHAGIYQRGLGRYVA